jgi:HK97 family phage major capsid protein
MAISLTAKAEKIGLQRRKVAELQSKREEFLKSFTQVESKLDELQSKLDGWKEGDADSQESLAGQVNSTREEMSKLRSQAMSASDVVNSERNILSQLEEDYRMIESSNLEEQRLSSSVGAGARPIGNDGGSLGSNLFSQGGGASDAARVRVLPSSPEQQRHDLGVYLQCELLRQVDHLSSQQTVELAANHFGNDRVSSAMQANIHSAGGSLVAGAFSTAWIELLRAKAIMRQSGCLTLPIDDGSLTIGRKTGASTSYYRGEGQNATISELTTGDMRLVAKEMVTMVSITEKLARSPSAGATAMVRDDIIESASLCEDLFFIRGTAAGAGPTGMRFLAPSANVLTMTATPDLIKVTNDLGRLELVLMSGNVDVTEAHWAMSPRTLIYLMNLREPTTQAIAFPEISMNMTLRKKPIHVTTQIPENLSTNQSELYLFHPRSCVIGDVPNMSIVASNVAAYQQGASVVAAFSKGEIVTRLTMENDFNLRQLAGVAVLTGLTWGV